MFRTVPLSIIRRFSLYTQQWYMSYRFSDSLRAGSGRNVLILLARQRNCPKHVEFYSKNKFEKLVHLVGFIIRTCHEYHNVGRHYDFNNATDLEARQELDYGKQYTSYKNIMPSQVHIH